MADDAAEGCVGIDPRERTTRPKAESASTHGSGRRGRRLSRHPSRQQRGRPARYRTMKQSARPKVMLLQSSLPDGRRNATRRLHRALLHRDALRLRSNSSSSSTAFRNAVALNFRATTQSEVERRKRCIGNRRLCRSIRCLVRVASHVVARPFDPRRINCLHNRRLGGRIRQCPTLQLSAQGDKSCRNPAFFGASRRPVPAILTHRIHAPLPASRSSSPRFRALRPLLSPTDRRPSHAHA